MQSLSGPSDALLRLFLEIAKDESLTKTAERLNVSQPSLQGEFALPIILTRIKELGRDAGQHQPFPV